MFSNFRDFIRTKSVPSKPVTIFAFCLGIKNLKTENLERSLLFENQKLEIKIRPKFTVNALVQGSGPLKDVLEYHLIPEHSRMR